MHNMFEGQGTTILSCRRDPLRLPHAFMVGPWSPGNNRDKAGDDDGQPNSTTETWLLFAGAHLVVGVESRFKPGMGLEPLMPRAIAEDLD